MRIYLRAFDNEVLIIATENTNYAVYKACEPFKTKAKYSYSFNFVRRYDNCCRIVQF